MREKNTKVEDQNITRGIIQSVQPLRKSVSQFLASSQRKQQRLNHLSFFKYGDIQMLIFYEIRQIITLI